MKNDFWIAALVGLGVALLFVKPISNAIASGTSGSNNPPGTVGGTGPDSTQQDTGAGNNPPVVFKNTPSGY